MSTYPADNDVWLPPPAVSACYPADNDVWLPPDKMAAANALGREVGAFLQQSSEYQSDQDCDGAFAAGIAAAFDNCFEPGHIVLHLAGRVAAGGGRVNDTAALGEQIAECFDWWDAGDRGDFARALGQVLGIESARAHLDWIAYRLDK